MPNPVSGADLLARIQPKLREDSTFICLRPDLIEQWEQANERLQESTASQFGSQRLTTKSAGDVELAEQVQDLERQIEEASAEFRFRALPKERWRALCDNHPPRKHDEMDRLVGYHRIEVLDAAVRKCLIDPVFDDASWATFLDTISEGEFSELRRLVNSINTGAVDNPKSVLASRILNQRGATSEQPAASE